MLSVFLPSELQLDLSDHPVDPAHVGFYVPEYMGPRESLELGALFVVFRWGVFAAIGHAPSLSPTCSGMESPRWGD